MAVGERQYGVFGRAQALDIGFSPGMIDWRVASGRWETTLRHVYRFRGAPETWHQRLMSACLWGGNQAVASHRSAGRLWRFDGFEAGDGIEITVPYGQYERVPNLIVHRTRRLDPLDRTERGGIPVTGVERTLVDLAAILEGDALEATMESAFRMGLTSLRRVWGRTDKLGGRRGLRALRRLLRARQDEPSQSLWELKLLQLIRSAGFPEPIRQYPVWDGQKLRRIDLAYPELLIGIEYDSYRHHSGRHAWEAGHTRNSNLVALGWRMLLIAMNDIDRWPQETVAKLRHLRLAAGAAA